MGVFWLNTSIVSGQGKRWCFPVDVPTCATIEEVTAILDRGHTVVGEQLFTVDDGHGRKMIRRRERVAVTSAGVATINPYNVKVWDPDGGSP